MSFCDSREVTLNASDEQANSSFPIANMRLTGRECAALVPK